MTAEVEVGDQGAGWWSNNQAGYGRISRWIHWATAILMVAIVLLGLYSVGLSRRDPSWHPILLVHKSLGLLVLFLTIVRLAWLSVSPAHLDAKGMKDWELVAARIGHFMLYGMLLAMPLSGVLWVVISGGEVTFFEWVTLPKFFPVEPGLRPNAQPYYKLGELIHAGILQWVVYAIFAFHMAGVVKHQFIDGDRRFIRRMWGGCRPPEGSGEP